MEPDEQLMHMRHTLAHLLAQAVCNAYPHAKPTIGPATSTGFYYDFDFSGGDTPSEGDLKALQTAMRKNLSRWTAWERAVVTPDDARERFAENPYKQELIDELEKGDAEITLYTCGEFTDLCRGGHAENPAETIDPKAFMLTSIAGAYWRGDEKNQMLTRIYGLAFDTPDALQEHLTLLEEARKRDHRKIGKEMDLFTFSDLVGPGLPLWTPRGTLLRDLITQRIQTIQQRFGFEPVTIPHITKKELYETSGHWEKFGDELFKVTGQSAAEFVMKPMNCPHHTQIYAGKQRSYKDLPIRYSETTMVYRDEQAGELLGLSRVRSITQDDGHVFARPDQIREEISNIASVIRTFYTSLGMFDEGNYWVSVSVRDPEEPEKYLGSDDAWREAETILEEVVQSESLPYTRVEGEAAFYGPKVDFMFKDAIGREWQLATIQLDFVMPERFELEYVNESGEKERPVMIHRAVAGSLERFLSVIIEHFAGAFPTWLAPEQVRVIPVADTHAPYAHDVTTQLTGAGYRASCDTSAETLGKRIRNAKVAKVPYILVVGDTEVSAQTLMVEHRDEKVGALTLEEFLKRLAEETAI